MLNRTESKMGSSINHLSTPCGVSLSSISRATHKHTLGLAVITPTPHDQEHQRPLRDLIGSMRNNFLYWSSGRKQSAKATSAISVSHGGLKAKLGRVKENDSLILHHSPFVKEHLQKRDSPNQDSRSRHFGGSRSWTATESSLLDNLFSYGSPKKEKNCRSQIDARTDREPTARPRAISPILAQLDPNVRGDHAK